MKNVFSIILVVFVIGFVLFFLIGRENSRVTPPFADEGQGNAPLETVETLYGFSYAYRTGNDGYVVYTPEDATRGNLVFTQSILDADDYEDFSQNKIPREGPVAFTLSVYRNPMQQGTREWITQNAEASNYNLSLDGTIETTTLGDTEYLSYQFDGLYRADAYVFGNNGYIYLFTNMWDNPESAMKKDMEELLASIAWNDPRVQAQTAHGDIFVSQPIPSETITSPLRIEGQARGMWYFEATFPLVLVDWDGRIIAEGFAQAQSDWMTEEFVPFVGEMTYTKPEDNDRGTLILQKSNASGLPEHDDAIEVPVVFN